MGRPERDNIQVDIRAFRHDALGHVFSADAEEGTLGAAAQNDHTGTDLSGIFGNLIGDIVAVNGFHMCSFFRCIAAIA